MSCKGREENHSALLSVERAWETWVRWVCVGRFCWVHGYLTWCENPAWRQLGLLHLLHIFFTFSPPSLSCSFCSRRLSVLPSVCQQHTHTPCFPTLPSAVSLVRADNRLFQVAAIPFRLCQTNISTFFLNIEATTPAAPLQHYPRSTVRSFTNSLTHQSKLPPSSSSRQTFQSSPSSS